jgi:hypothetical protein
LTGEETSAVEGDDACGAPDLKKQLATNCAHYVRRRTVSGGEAAYGPLTITGHRHE